MANTVLLSTQLVSTGFPASTREALMTLQLFQDWLNSLHDNDHVFWIYLTTSHYFSNKDLQTKQLTFSCYLHLKNHVQRLQLCISCADRLIAHVVCHDCSKLQDHKVSNLLAPFSNALINFVSKYAFSLVHITPKNVTSSLL